MHTLKVYGQPGLSEARAVKNAATYNPIRTYVIEGESMARISLPASQAYTESRYCEWAGPKYSERLVAVGEPRGSGRCIVMTESGFGR